MMLHITMAKITKSMRIAMQDLDLHHLYVVYPGSDNYPLEKNIFAISIQKLDLSPIGKNTVKIR